MAEKKIPWNDGSGDNVTITYDDNYGNQVVKITSDFNYGIEERDKLIKLKSASGNTIINMLFTQQRDGIGDMEIGNTFIIG